MYTLVYDAAVVGVRRYAENLKISQTAEWRPNLFRLERYTIYVKAAKTESIRPFDAAMVYIRRYAEFFYINQTAEWRSN